MTLNGITTIFFNYWVQPTFVLQYKKLSFVGVFYSEMHCTHFFL